MIYHFLSLLAVLVLFSSCHKGGIGDVEIKTDKQKVSYAIGQQIGMGIKSQKLEVDVAVLAMSIQDFVEGKTSRLNQDEMRLAMEGMQKGMVAKQTEEGKKNKDAGEKFLAENKNKPNIKTTASGLQYEVLKEAKGKAPVADDVVKVHYRGTLLDGSEFDSSYKKNQPAEFPLKGVIKGWTEGLQLMTVGSKWKFFVPSGLAYGEMGRPGIPPNSVLVFEVELIEIMGSGSKDKPKKKK